MFTAEEIELHEILLSFSGGCSNKLSRQCFNTKCSEVVEVQIAEGGLYNLSYIEFLKEVLRKEQKAVFFCHDTGMMFPVELIKDA